MTIEYIFLEQSQYYQFTHKKNVSFEITRPETTIRTDRNLITHLFLVGD